MWCHSFWYQYYLTWCTFKIRIALIESHFFNRIPSKIFRPRCLYRKLVNQLIIAHQWHVFNYRTWYGFCFCIILHKNVLVYLSVRYECARKFNSWRRVSTILSYVSGETISTCMIFIRTYLPCFMIILTNSTTKLITPNCMWGKNLRKSIGIEI